MQLQWFFQWQTSISSPNDCSKRQTNLPRLTSNLTSCFCPAGRWGATSMLTCQMWVFHPGFNINRFLLPHHHVLLFWCRVVVVYPPAAHALWTWRGDGRGERSETSVRSAGWRCEETWALDTILYIYPYQRWEVVEYKYFVTVVKHIFLVSVLYSTT